MGPRRSTRKLLGRLLAPGVVTLAVALATATSVQAESSPPSQSSPGQNPSTAVTLGRTVTLGTVESTHLKQRLSAQAQPAGGPLVYHGGRVENTPQVYLSLWGSDWNGSAYQPTISYLQGFFANVGGSPWLGVTSQYYSVLNSRPNSPCAGPSICPISNPVGQLKATWIDNHDVSYSTPAGNCGSSRAGDCDVGAAAQRAADHFGPLPRGAMVMVFTPSGRSQPGFVSDGWCAYHGATGSSGVVFGYIPYLPDAGRSCGRNSVNAAGPFDGFSIVGGHEYVEAITDPYPFLADPSPDWGWTDASGYENGDKCAWYNLANISLGGRPYAVQPTWSNADNGCQIGIRSGSGGPPPRPQPPPLTTFSVLQPGGTLTSAPAATSWGAGRLDVFVRGGGNALIHRSSSGGTWTNWETVGGVLSSEPAAVSWSPNRLDVFVRGTDNALWHTFGDGTRWSGWESLGGKLKAGPTVASWGPGRLDVFVTGTDNGVWHKWYGGGWSSWESQGGATTSGPAAVSAGSGVVDVFTRASDNTLQHRAYNGSSWSGWDNLGGTLTWAPAVTATGIDQTAVIVRGDNGLLYRNNWNGGAWSGFFSVGAQTWPAVSSPTVQPGTLNLDLFAQGADGALWRATSPVVT
jgi:hypothetical protein